MFGKKYKFFCTYKVRLYEQLTVTDRKVYLVSPYKMSDIEQR